jgi:hypothetical protein
MGFTGCGKRLGFRLKAKNIPQGLKPALILRHLRHDSSRALTLLAFPNEFFRSL